MDSPRGIASSGAFVMGYFLSALQNIVCRIQSNTGGIAENAQANTYPRERNSANCLRIFGKSKPRKCNSLMFGVTK